MIQAPTNQAIGNVSIDGSVLKLSNFHRCLARISEVKLRINVSTLRLTAKCSVSEVASIISFETVSTRNGQFCCF